MIQKTIGNSYLGFRFIVCKLARRQSIIVKNETELMIEGYPRSGNTYAVAAFNVAQGREVQIARHRHEAGHVIMAIKLHKPVMLVIREPISAAISLCLRERIDAGYALTYYLEFHNKLLPYKDKMLIAEFGAVVEGYGDIVEQLNQRFGLTYRPYRDSLGNRSKVDKLIREMDEHEVMLYNPDLQSGHNMRLSIPTIERNLEKDKFRREICENGRYAKLILMCQEIYGKFVSI